MIKAKIDYIVNQLNLEKETINFLTNSHYDTLSNSHTFKFNDTCRISNFLGLTVEQFIEDDFDIQLIKKKFLSPSLALPPEYLPAGGTFIDTIKGVVDFVEKILGKEARRRILNNIQITESVLRTPHLLVNANCLLKTGKALRDINFSDEDINQMAYFINLQSRRSEVAKIVKDCKMTSDVAEIMCQSTGSYYDNNFKYHIEKENSTFTIVGVSNEEIHDQLNISSICDEIFTKFKAYTVSNATVAQFKKPMHLIKIKSELLNHRQIQRFTFKDSILQ